MIIVQKLLGKYIAILCLIIFFFFPTITVLAHPLGNFTINHFIHLDIASSQLKVTYILDMAEIPTFQERQTIDKDNDGVLSVNELDIYAQQTSQKIAENLLIKVNDSYLQLEVVDKKINLLPGAGGLATLRLESHFQAKFTNNGFTNHLDIEDHNHNGRLGWREMFVSSQTGISLFNSTIYGNSVTDELKLYPTDMIAAPLNEQRGKCEFATLAPKGSHALLNRHGQAITSEPDRFVSLISVPELSPKIIVFGILISIFLGSFHALSPGHGKTIVGAYLVGSRGTAKHAIFLGLIVTITHTIGVFLLGLITLFASKYILPEQIFPILSLISGAVVIGIGLSLFAKRLLIFLGYSNATLEHNHSHYFDLKTSSDNVIVNWNNLIALGVSGGLLPCPSALVVLLSAISLHRVGYGLLLVFTFSLGLAGSLTIVGLLFLYAKNFLGKPFLSSPNLVNLLPVLSSLVITIVGGVICYETLKQTDFTSFGASFSQRNNSAWASTISIIGLGFVLGLRHALEADHLAAVTTIVSESKSLLSSSLVGILWGIGHTISLLVAGVIVILLHIQITEKVANSLEFCVGLMLIFLGVNALIKLINYNKKEPNLLNSKQQNLEITPEKSKRQFSLRPMIVGMVHGMAGSAALMLLVVATTSSALLSLAYIIVFGIGSIGGMLIMSFLVSMPMHLTATYFTRVNLTVRALAGVFSFLFGLFMVYKIGYVESLFQ
jgi:ABC-type nickel/cobalt efflux system permease component RcnA